LGTDRLNSHFLRPYLLHRCLCLQYRQSTGGCQGSLVDKLGVSSSRYHHTMVHIAHHPGMNTRPVEATVLRLKSHTTITNLPMYLRRKFRATEEGWKDKNCLLRRRDYMNKGHKPENCLGLDTR
jgi:hypothetical protein